MKTKTKNTISPSRISKGSFILMSCLLVHLAVNAQSHLALSVTKKDAPCYGDSGSFTIKVTGGTKPYHVQITNLLFVCNNNSNCTGMNPCFVYTCVNTQCVSYAEDATCDGVLNSALRVAAGSYAIQASDAKGAIAIDTVTINQPTPLVLTSTPQILPCSGGQGTVEVNVSGGTGPYNVDFYNNGGNGICFCQDAGIDWTSFCVNGHCVYAWDPFLGGFSSLRIVSGSYSDTLSDGNGCTITDALVLPEETVSVNPSDTISACNSLTLSAVSNATGLKYQWLKKGSAHKVISGATNSTYTAKKSDNYSVSVTNSEGCSLNSAITTVTISPTPPATITVSPCQNHAVILTANSGSGYTYQWIKGTKNIKGATNQTYSATTPATYKVSVTNGNGCSKTSAGAKVTISCREELITDNSSLASLTFYPNPTSGKFSIKLNLNNDLNEVATIDILNELGEVIYSTKEPTVGGVLKKNISLASSTPDGIYLVKIIAGNKMSIGRLVYSK